MLRKFHRDVRGNYMVATAIAVIPVMGALAMAVDFSEMNRHRSATLHALDASGIATARQIIKGATDAEAKAFAKDFFEANLGPVDPANATLFVTLPSSSSGGGVLTMSAQLKYKPHFLPAFSYLMGSSDGKTAVLDLSTESKVRLKNTIEVALVLDNSGSMSSKGYGSSQQRITLLKDASKQLVDQLAAEAANIQQVTKPVQFAVVPFSASVNVGSQYAGASWMDQDGLSPIHHENFDWTSLDGGATQSGGVWYDSENNKLTRWRLFDSISYITGWNPAKTEKKCVKWYWGRCWQYDYVEVEPATPITAKATSWTGCVEARPYPYNVDDTPASTGTPATLFVPLFAPDENDQVGSYTYKPASNNWWEDHTSNSDPHKRQANMQKYFEPLDGSAPSLDGYHGPNYSCTTTAITPLQDVTTSSGKSAVKSAIDAMQPTGYTDVPEGIAWGWRAVSSIAPFTEGRAEAEKGNDKVVIVLTDGMNTYEDLGSSDPVGNKSRYAAYGYTGVGYDGGSVTRMFLGTSGDVGKYDFSSGNYTAALDEQMDHVCQNAKNTGLLVVTVGLDLNPSSDATMISALENCASESKFNKDKKLFWNAQGKDLNEVFKEIADELSNLRIVG